MNIDKEYLRNKLSEIELKLNNYKNLNYSVLLDLKMEQIKIEKLIK